MALKKIDSFGHLATVLSCVGEVALANPNGIPSLSPGLRGTSYPGSRSCSPFNPNGVASSAAHPAAATPLGLGIFGATTQGGSFLATLGWMTQSLWDRKYSSRCTTQSVVSRVLLNLDETITKE